MQTIFRVDEVLRGDSPTVALVGRDAGDRQVRLEVPAAMVGGVRVGSALVIAWWTAEIPAATSGPATVGPSSPWPRSSEASQATAGSAATPTGSASSASSASAASAAMSGEAASAGFDEERLEQEFRALIGLR